MVFHSVLICAQNGNLQHMNTTKPLRKPGIIVLDIGHETLLYNVRGKAVHILNPTARLIWELCDGVHTVAEIEQAIRSKFSVVSEHDVSGDIQRTLEAFASKGVLENKA